MKPWVNRGHKNYELRRSGTNSSSICFSEGSAAPLGLNKYVSIINPGLAPWAMQEYRPYRAPLRLPYHFIILMRLSGVTIRIQFLNYYVTFVEV